MKKNSLLSCKVALELHQKKGLRKKMDNSCIKGSIESGKWEVTLTVITLFEIKL
jgi:hypothetical protein